MSNDSQTTSSVSRLSLTQQRKRAKELLKALRAADPEAMQRAKQHLPGAIAPYKLAQAQLVVAREAGFPSWTRLKLYATQVGQSRSALIESVLTAALTGHEPAVETALGLVPDLATDSIHVAAALADESALTEHLKTDRGRACLRDEVRGFSPLAYLCHARLGRERAESGARRARLAKLLLDAGAHAKECVDTNETPGGKFSVLSAAARHTASVELVEVLLAAGAELEPEGSTAGPPAPPLVAAAMGGDLDCVRRLIAAKAPRWQAREALEIAVAAGDANMARALLQYGASPDHAGRWAGRHGGCLHAALMLGRDAEFLRVLLEGGASVTSRDRDGRTPLEIAVRVNAIEAAALLREHGASDEEVDALDRLLGACAACDRERTDAILAEEPQLVRRARISDHQMVCWATRQGRTAALAELLRAGFDANLPDDDGQTALHLAIRRSDVKAVELLVRHGASAGVRDYENVTPVEAALSEGDPDLRRALLSCLSGSDRAREVARLLGPDDEIELSEGADVEDFPEALFASQSQLGAAFEDAVSKMEAGDVEGLRALLDREPRLATARSPRYHRATLLHYLSSNGTERVVVPKNAARIAELLLERGAVVDASCRMYGGGPDQTTLGLVVTSCFPEQSGLMDDLVGVLVKAGAKIQEPDGTSSALAGAIMYSAPNAVRALAKNGVRPWDLPSAAALGDVGYVDEEIEKHAATSEPLVSALQNAAAFGHIAVLKRLVSFGIDVNARSVDEYAVTALHKAAAANQAEAIRLLLQNGADRTLRDHAHHGTPADWAAHSGAEQAQAALTEA